MKESMIRGHALAPQPEKMSGVPPAFMYAAIIEKPLAEWSQRAGLPAEERTMLELQTGLAAVPPHTYARDTPRQSQLLEWVEAP